MATGSAAPITAASEMRRRWCVQKEVVAVNLITGPHSTACVYVRRAYRYLWELQYMAQVGRKILTLGEGFTTQVELPAATCK